MQLTLKQWGNSCGVRFTKEFMKQAGLKVDDTLNAEVIDGRIPASYPLIPGHEWSGIVDAVGDPSDEAWIGRPVIGSNDVVCLTCEACRSGNWRYCSSFEEIGFGCKNAAETRTGDAFRTIQGERT